MEKIKQILPQNFEIVNGINYFRLEDGRVAVERTSNVTINSSKEDIVELITLEYDSKTVRFWKTKGKLYALASKSCVTIPEDTTFVDCYSSENYLEGQYVKYISTGRCGIIYVSETEVSHVISYEKGYTEICFENNLFYADSKKGDNKYHVIGESGKLLGAFPSKCRKLDGYMLFYDDSSIFINSSSSKWDISGGVTSVEIIKQDKITFVKVINNNGIYYYTKGIEYLFGPIKEDEIHSINQESCFVYEVVNKKVVQVFYTKVTEDTYVCKNLSSTKGIECHIFSSEPNGKFFVADKVLYVLQDEEFISLINGVDTDEYVISAQARYSSGTRWSYTIVGYKKNIPVYFAYCEKKEVYDEGTLEQVADGHEDQNIFRKGEYIVIIDNNGKVVLYVKGKNCYKKKCSYNTSIYVVEQDEDNIEIYWTNGKKML